METGNGLVCVVIPRERLLLPYFVDSRDMVIASLRQSGLYGGCIQIPGCRIDVNRNKLCEEFLKDERQAEWLLFLDNDMTFPPEIGKRLVRWQQPVVGGLYFQVGGGYDPHVYNIGRVRPDKYGRQTQHWNPMREEVYEFLVANKAPSVNMALALDNPVCDPLLECDGIGTGALLIHRSVLEKLSPPWFGFNGSEGEDLLFCKRVREQLGYPVFADLSTICGHIDPIALGHTQFMQAYSARAINATRYSPEVAAQWLADFVSIKADDALAGLQNYHPSQMGDLWKRCKPKTASQVLEFYQRQDVGNLYIYELLRWNMSDFFSGLRSNLKSYRDVRVLEIGSGIGTIAIQLAYQGCNVTATETNSALRDFTMKRWKRTKELVPHRNDGKLKVQRSLPRDGEFDLVVATDVFEHVHSSVLPRMLRHIGKIVPKRGRIFHHNNWGQQELFPFHYDHGMSWERWLENAGFFLLDDFWSIKVQ